MDRVHFRGRPLGPAASPLPSSGGRAVPSRVFLSPSSPGRLLGRLSQQPAGHLPGRVLPAPTLLCHLSTPHEGQSRGRPRPSPCGGVAPPGGGASDKPVRRCSSRCPGQGQRPEARSRQEDVRRPRPQKGLCWLALEGAAGNSDSGVTWIQGLRHSPGTWQAPPRSKSWQLRPLAKAAAGVGAGDSQEPGPRPHGQALSTVPRTAW